MKKITQYNEISPLIMRYFKRGVLTNNFLAKEDYISEIEEGRLFCKTGDDFLNIYVLRDGFYRLYFHALNEEVVFPSINGTIVCDCVGYEEFFARNGFKKVLERIKLECANYEVQIDTDAFTASVSDADKVYEIMQSSFNLFTGYLPTFTQIKNECENGLIYKTEDCEKITGVLRCAKTNSSVQIKHLCVSQEFRGCGIGRKLCSIALGNGKKCTVWTGKENKTAIGLYESCGFTQSGLESIVYRKDV